jgi:hypothetical protein
MVRQVLTVAALALALQAAPPAPAPPPVDAAFAKYWDAKTPAEAAKPAADIVKSGAA